MGSKLADGPHNITWTGNSLGHAVSPTPSPVTVSNNGDTLTDRWGNEYQWNPEMEAYVRLRWNSVGPPTVHVWAFEADGSTTLWSSHMGGYSYWGTYT